MENQITNKASPQVNFFDLTRLDIESCWDYYKFFASSNNRPSVRGNTEEEDAKEVIERKLINL